MLLVHRPAFQPFRTLITLGFDPAHKVLTLDTEGPRFADDGTLAKYQDIIEIIDADQYLLSSQYQTPDGTWCVGPKLRPSPHLSGAGLPWDGPIGPSRSGRGGSGPLPEHPSGGRAHITQLGGMRTPSPNCSAIGIDGGRHGDAQPSPCHSIGLRT